MTCESDGVINLPLFEADSDPAGGGQRTMAFPRELAKDATAVYLLPGAHPGDIQYVLVNYNQAAEISDLVLFYHSLWQRYLVVSRAELPYYIRTVDPSFDHRPNIDLEDMHLGVVLSVCVRLRTADS